jgi:hypothetical protein
VGESNEVMLGEGANESMSHAHRIGEGAWFWKWKSQP